VIIVALHEDPRIRLVGSLVASETGAVNEIDPTTLEIGTPVRVIFQRLTDEIHLPRWTPV
jgi:hypothetical protein